MALQLQIDDINDLAENTAFLKAVESKEISLEILGQLPPFDELKPLESKLKAEGKFTFHTIFHEPVGYYMFKLFLTSEYFGDKAVYIKDIETYRNMRFESARRPVAKLIFDRFIAEEDENKFPKGSSVFEIIQTELKKRQDREQKGGDGHAGNNKSNGNGQANAAALAGSDSHEWVYAFGATEPPPPLPIVPKNTGGVIADDDNDNEDDDNDKQRGRHSPDHREKLEEAGDEKDVEEEKPIIFTPPPPKNKPDTREPNNLRETLTKPLKYDLQIGQTNAIGVYGQSVKTVKDLIDRGAAPADLFQEVSEDVMNDLQYDVFPRFLKSSFYRNYVRTKYIETKSVASKDFLTLRLLGRGGFGAVSACRKYNSGALYAMKCINKKLVKLKSALSNLMDERDVLSQVNSPFVTGLKYAFQDEDNLYLIMDLMLGGDLKYHLINAQKFSPERARFYAAEVLLGLEHLHSLNIIYRDMKLENILLDHTGHCKLSDLGLAASTKVKIRGYAGTPGYTAPEMIKNKLYGPSVDVFSYGVLIYRMLAGTKPFKGRIDRDLDKAVVEKEPKFPPEIFDDCTTNLLQGLLQKKPESRLGCGPRGIDEIKEHPYFSSIDWGLLEAGYLDPPFVPSFDVHAPSVSEIGKFDMEQLKDVKLNERFQKTLKRFDFLSVTAVQEELVAVLEKAAKGVDITIFAPVVPPKKIDKEIKNCCVLL